MWGKILILEKTLIPVIFKFLFNLKEILIRANLSNSIFTLFKLKLNNYCGYYSVKFTLVPECIVPIRTGKNYSLPKSTVAPDFIRVLKNKINLIPNTMRFRCFFSRLN